MKSVCIDARMLDSGGIGTYLRNLLKNIETTSFKFYAIVHPFHLEPYKTLWDCIEPIPIDSPIYSVSEQWKLSMTVPHCDLFWSPHYNIPLLPIRARRRMTTIHDVYHLAFFQSLRPIEKFYAKIVMEAAVRYSDAIITDSEFSKQELKKYTSVKEAKLQVIYPGIDTHIFSPSTEKISQNSLIFPKPFLLFVGNLKPHKNLKGLIQAFDLLDQEGLQDVSLVVIGKTEGFKTGEDIVSLIGSAPHLKSRIHFLGNISDKDLVYAYHSALALVLPSFYEGFGFPPLEAMSANCPVIVSQSASLPEICAEGALYIEKNTPRGIADAVHKLLGNQRLREQLKKEGLMQSKRYCWKLCAEKHLKIMEQLTSR